MYKLKIFIITLPFILASSYAYGSTWQQDKATQIYNNYGVRVHFEYERNKFFDYYERTVDEGRCAGSASKKEISVFLNQLATFLKKYPKRLIRKTLKNIYFCRGLSFYGIKRFAGAYYGNKIWGEQRKRGSSREFYEKMLHHEYSSVLLKKHKYKFPKKRWLRISGSGYYGGDFTCPLGGAWHHTRAMRQDGFLYCYSKTNFENDFNVLAESYLHTGGERMMQGATRNYPNLRAKLEIIKDYYRWLFAR